MLKYRLLFQNLKFWLSQISSHVIFPLHRLDILYDTNIWSSTHSDNIVVKCKDEVKGVY